MQRRPMMKKLMKIEENFNSILILSLTLLTILQVLSRYVFMTSLPWVEELARYLMIFMVYIGSAVAVFRHDHFKVELLELFLSKQQLRVVDNIYQVILILF